MARSIAVDATEVWRAVIVLKNFYQGWIEQADITWNKVKD